MASSIAYFGMPCAYDVTKAPRLPVFITEGDLPSKCFLDKRQMVEGGTFSNDGTSVSHADEVTHVTLQVDKLAKIGGAHAGNLKKPGIFNFSYCRTFYTQPVPSISYYEGEKKERVTNSGYSAILCSTSSNPKATTNDVEEEPSTYLGQQIYVQSAGNSFSALENPNFADGEKFQTIAYINYINSLIGKYSGMGIFCSEMTVNGCDLESWSCRPLTDAQALHFICCPKALFMVAPYNFINGTSFSSPMVSGLASRMARDFPAISPKEIRDIILITASKAHLVWNQDSFQVVNLTQRRFGQGLLSIKNAYTLAQKVAQQRQSGGTFLSWEALRHLYIPLQKQVIIYPSFTSQNGIASYHTWLECVFDIEDEAVQEEILGITADLSILSYDQLENLIPSLNGLLLNYQAKYAKRPQKMRKKNPKGDDEDEVS